MGSEVIVTTSNFEDEVIHSDIPVLIDFWAQWCVPCKMIGPILEEIAEEYSGRIKVVKINVDEAGDIATRYSIISIPTLMLFKSGEVINQQVGAVSKQTIEGLFRNLL